MGDYNIEDIYQGGYSSLKPSYGDVFTGYRIEAGKMGITTDPRTANVLQEVSSKLSTGVKQIEVEGINPEILESIPVQHLKELNRLAKLTGISVSLHGPIIEPSGFSREGYSEQNRESTETQMINAIERAHEINPEGSSPVTFHSSAGIPGRIETKGKRPADFLVMDNESGDLKRLSLKERHFPEEGEIGLKKELDRINEDAWDNHLTNLGFAVQRANQFIDESALLKYGKEAEEKAGKMITPAEKEAEQLFIIGNNYLKDSYRQLKEIYNISYRYGSDEEKTKLNELGKEIHDKIKIINTTQSEAEKINLMRDVIAKSLKGLGEISPPRIYEPLKEFAEKKTTTTFANVAFDAYKKYKDKAPIVSIENPPVGSEFARGEDLKRIVEETRNKFVDRAMKEGISEGEAKRQAEKLIGVTWDVGHINMLRKYGYEKEDIIKESEKIKPFVKHVHLSDNFGLEHTELPMGMGNVPTKEIMEKLGKEGFEAKKIIEAASWWQHFKAPPVQESFEALGSPVYSEGVGPYWNQSLGFQQEYFGGYGLMLPQVNYETFGSGFSQLPVELGGQKQAAGGSRMSGKPME